MSEPVKTFLRLGYPPAGQPRDLPRPDARVAREHPSPDCYAALWREVGEPVCWDLRQDMGTADFGALLRRPDVHVFILRLAGTPVGLCEFAGAGEAETELCYFGLVPRAQGQGLGAALLDFSLRRVWTPKTRRIWLHTDTDDDPSAIPVYLRAGFCVYDPCVGAS